MKIKTLTKFEACPLSFLSFSCFLSLIVMLNACVTAKLDSDLGEFTIGTREFVLHTCMVESDNSRSCPATDILVQAWYPATVKDEALAPYILDTDQAVPALAEASGAPEFMVRKVARIQTNSYLNAAVSAREPSYPLILFSHGYHSLRMQNTVLMEQLASRGQIVLAVQHAYDAAVTVMPDGKVIPSVAPVPDTKSLDVDDAIRGSWTNRRVGEDKAVLADLDAIPKDLATAIDHSKMAVIGHSMGGSTVTAVCREVESLKACINLDGPLRGTRQEADLKHPVLFIEAEMPQYEGKEDEAFYKNRIRSFKESAKKGYVYLRIKETGHLNFTDFPVVSSFPLNWFSRSEGDLGGEKSRNITFYLVKSFLDHAFAGETMILTPDELARYSEVELIQKSGPVAR